LRRATRLVRVKLYSSFEAFRRGKGCLDENDFPLEANGDLDFRQVKEWWGIQACSVRYPQMTRLTH
jgi:hypothetical protein